MMWVENPYGAPGFQTRGSTTSSISFGQQELLLLRISGNCPFDHTSGWIQIMKRWSQVERLFNQALERPPSDRKAFLEKACSHDGDLRKEIESLLEYHQRAADFIETPAMDLEARKLARDQLADASGRQVGPYMLLSLIGIGGMAAVYKARDERSGELVALKLLPLGLTEDRYRLRRFNREAKALRRLSHKNIARFYETGESDGQNYIAMELVKGETIEELIRRERLTQDQILSIAIQVVDALVSAHTQKIIHRDLKPSNLIISESGEVKMLDFGLAKALATSGLSSTGDFSLESLTRTGTVLGTVDYMSPEQIRAGEVDHRSDLFAVGVLIYQMTTGHVPFHGKSYGDTIRRILDEPPNRITRVNDDPSLGNLEEIVLTCLQKHPSDRYQSAEALLQDLKVAAGEPVDLVKGTSRLWEKGKRKYWALAVGGLLTLLVLWLLVSG
jgi:hypothetical protein